MLHYIPYYTIIHYTNDISLCSSTMLTLLCYRTSPQSTQELLCLELLWIHKDRLSSCTAHCTVPVQHYSILCCALLLSLTILSYTTLFHTVLEYYTVLNYAFELCRVMQNTAKKYHAIAIYFALLNYTSLFCEEQLTLSMRLHRASK